MGIGLSEVLIGVVGFAISKFIQNIDNLEKENKQKQEELDRARTQFERENKIREDDLKRVAKLNDAVTALQAYRKILDVEESGERTAVAYWEETKAHMRKLKERECKARSYLVEVKEKINKCKKTTGISRGACQSNGDAHELHEQLKVLRAFDKAVVESIRSYAKTKKEVWEALQVRNKQKQIALKQWLDCKSAKRFFECVYCGKRFAITVGQLADFQKRGFQPPKRCKECREQKKLFMKG